MEISDIVLWVAGIGFFVSAIAIYVLAGVIIFLDRRSKDFVFCLVTYIVVTILITLLTLYPESGGFLY